MNIKKRNAPIKITLGDKADIEKDEDKYIESEPIEVWGEFKSKADKLKPTPVPSAEKVKPTGLKGVDLSAKAKLGSLKKREPQGVKEDSKADNKEDMKKATEIMAPSSSYLERIKKRVK